MTTKRMSTASLTVHGFLNAEAGLEIESRRLAGRKRRALVLTSESARHPFRAELAPHVTQIEEGETPVSLWRLTKDDVRGFATTYFSVFAAVLVFIL
jgi:hypothetical protein